MNGIPMSPKSCAARELVLAMGGGNMLHAAVADGGVARLFRTDSRRGRGGRVKDGFPPDEDVKGQ